MNGPLHRFADWPSPALPLGRAGVYTVWRGEEFIYVGMAGRSLKAAAGSGGGPAEKPRKGLWGRLDSHASGRRLGDQFCTYVFDRLLLPDLSRQQIAEAASGRLSLDGLVRTFVREMPSYRYALVSDADAAFAVERHIQRKGWQVGYRSSISSRPRSASASATVPWEWGW